MRQLNQIHALLIKNPKPQVLNPWLGYLANSSAPQNALFLYNQMLHHPTSHNHYTFTYGLKACCLLHSPHKGQEIQAHVIKSGHISDTFIQNSLLHFYVIQSDIVSATRVFNSIPIPDVVSWTSMISGLFKCGFVEKAIVKFMSMDVEPNSTTLVTVLSSCSALRAIKFGKAVHCHCLRNLQESNLILDNVVLDFYLRCGSLVSARYLFVNMPKRDVVSWTIMVGGYAQRGFCEETVKLFQQLVQGREAEPNEATIVNVLSACSSMCALSSGCQVHSYISTRQDLKVNGNVGNALINMYVKCGNLGMAISVFQALDCKDIISWSTIISGLAMNGHGMHVLQLFSNMLVNGVSPDGVTFLGLLAACSHAGLIDQGLMFFNAMKKVYRIVPETQHYSCLVDMYGRAGLLEEAEAFIKEMPIEADGSVWGALLNACKIHGNEEMVERIRQGLLNSTGVSIGTYALLSNAYAKHDRWDDSNKVRDEMRKMGLKTPPGCSWIEIYDSDRDYKDSGVAQFTNKNVVRKYPPSEWGKYAWDTDNLLSRARFTLSGVDLDAYIVRYQSGEHSLFKLRETALATAAIYDSMFAAEDGTIPATFQAYVVAISLMVVGHTSITIFVGYFIGYYMTKRREYSSQQRTKRRQSATVLQVRPEIIRKS